MKTFLVLFCLVFLISTTQSSDYFASSDPSTSEESDFDSDLASDIDQDSDDDTGEYEGELQIVAYDRFEHGKSTSGGFKVYLKTRGKHVLLRLKTSFHQLMSSMRSGLEARISGKKSLEGSEPSINVDSITPLTGKCEKVKDTIEDAGAGSFPFIHLTRKYRNLKILVIFLPKISKLFKGTLEQVSATVQDVIKLYSDDSYGRVNMQLMDIITPQIDTKMSCKPCDFSCINSFARTNQEVAGKMSDESVIAVYPHDGMRGSCGYHGISSLGKLGLEDSYVFVSSTSTRVWAHEIGHSIGMSHSSSGTLDRVIAEYGDISCIMGSGETRFSSVWRDVMGWFTDSEISNIVLGPAMKRSIKISSLHTMKEEESTKLLRFRHRSWRSKNVNGVTTNFQDCKVYPFIYVSFVQDKMGKRMKNRVYVHHLERKLCDFEKNRIFPPTVVVLKSLKEKKAYKNTKLKFSISFDRLECEEGIDSCKAFVSVTGL